MRSAPGECRCELRHRIAPTGVIVERAATGVAEIRHLKQRANGRGTSRVDRSGRSHAFALSPDARSDGAMLSSIEIDLPCDSTPRANRQWSCRPRATPPATAPAAHELGLHIHVDGARGGQLREVLGHARGNGDIGPRELLTSLAKDAREHLEGPWRMARASFRARDVGDEQERRGGCQEPRMLSVAEGRWGHGSRMRVESAAAAERRALRARGP